MTLPNKTIFYRRCEDLQLAKCVGRSIGSKGFSATSPTAERALDMTQSRMADPKIANYVMLEYNTPSVLRLAEQRARV